MTGQPDIAAALAWSGEAARAAANAQAALRGEPVPALLISSEAHLAEAEASPANPYGSSKHGRFDAGSVAEVAEGVEPCVDCGSLLAYSHAEYCSWWQLAAQRSLCPAQWGEPPETMLCSLPSGHDGNHATAEGIEWAGKWETAELHPDGEPTPRELAAGYSLGPAEGVERQWCVQPVPAAVSRISYLCSLEKDHGGDHVAGGSEGPGGDPLTWSQETAEPGDVTR